MHNQDVPQDGVDYYAGARKALYALDAGGRYAAVPSSGWEVEAAATRGAIDELERMARAALEAARRGETSALEVHMWRARMDVATLAQSTGLWQWRVRRHLRPQVFSRLSERLLRTYADALGMAPAALRRLPDDDTPPRAAP